jgi:hypothetical protein
VLTTKSLVLAFVLALVLAAPLSAQTSVTIAVFASTAPDPNTATPVAPAVTYAMSGIACGQAKVTPAGNVVNPTTTAFDDPSDATKDCVINALPQLAALPNGTYRAAAHFDSDPAWSAFSNPFDRRRVANVRVR